MKTPRPRILGKLLVDHEGVDPAALEAALGDERSPRERVGETLVRLGAATPEAVARSLAVQLAIPVAEEPLDVDEEALALVRPELLRTHRLIPLSLSKRVVRVAMADPLNLSAVDDVQFQTGRRVEPVVATERSVLEALDRCLADSDATPGHPQRNGVRQGRGRRDVPSPSDDADFRASPHHENADGSGTDGDDPAAAPTRGADDAEDFSTLVQALPEALRATSPDGGDVVDADLEEATRRAPVVRLVDRILRHAIDDGASDIHVEETGRDVRVRLRIDGRLHRTLDLPAGARRAVLSRIKVLAGMDISVRRRAQDGRVAFAHEGRRLTLRVSTLPVNGGEKAVVRILDPDSAPRTLDVLGMARRDLNLLRSLLRRGEGVILAAGPTGSGKSTTLFAALSELDRESRNVVTVEDPVEYRLPGASQVQVERRAGLGFAEALRAILRQDPDVVMVGEIRDRETAEIAMAAAVTGHLVLSTIEST